MRILWIEDFDKSMNDQRALVENLFKELLNKKTFTDFPKNKKISEVLSDYFKKCGSIHEIEICHNWTEYDSLFGSRLFEFDIFIIDINLTAKGMSVSEKLIGYSKETFYKYAGFYIYNDIIRRGIDEDNISLVTGNSEDLKSICKNNAIPIPNNIFSKGDVGYSSFRAWLQVKANTNYIQLRRGILDACEFFQKNEHEILLNMTLKKDGEGEKIDELSKEYGIEFIIHIKNLFLKDFLLKEKDKTQKLYTFLMVLSAEWERGDSRDDEQSKHFKEIQNPSEKCFYESIFWIMSNLRNCFAHFTFPKENLKEQDIAFFFMLAMRGFFKMTMGKIEEYEKIFFIIFNNSNIEIDKNNLKEINGDALKKIISIYDGSKLDKAIKGIRNNKPIPIDRPNDFQGYVFRFLNGSSQNKNDKLKPIPRETIQKESKDIFYKSYLIKMETILVDTNSKDKLYYKLGAFALEADL